MSRWDDFVDDHPRVDEILAFRKYLPSLNFITIHYAYFIVVCLISSVIFWRSSDPAFSISYTDSLFLVVSAMTEAGLNTVNISQMTTWQQTILFLLIILGSTIWVSIWTVLARKHVFEKRFESVMRAERARKLRSSDTEEHDDETGGYILLERTGPGGADVALEVDKGCRVVELVVHSYLY